MLKKELGVEPSARMRAIVERLRSGEELDLDAETIDLDEMPEFKTSRPVRKSKQEIESLLPVQRARFALSGAPKARSNGLSHAILKSHWNRLQRRFKKVASKRLWPSLLLASGNCATACMVRGAPNYAQQAAHPNVSDFRSKSLENARFPSCTCWVSTA